MFPPQFFDIFGVLAFGFIIFLATRAIKKTIIPPWMFIILLGIGVVGLVVDSVIVYLFYLNQ